MGTVILNRGFVLYMAELEYPVLTYLGEPIPVLGQCLGLDSGNDH